jgi:hypothetical protein
MLMQFELAKDFEKMTLNFDVLVIGLRITETLMQSTRCIDKLHCMSL